MGRRSRVGALDDTTNIWKQLCDRIFGGMRSRRSPTIQQIFGVGALDDTTNIWNMQINVCFLQKTATAPF